MRHPAFDKCDFPVFHILSDLADSRGDKIYVIGGFVRDTLLGKDNDDIDICVVGSGTKFAEAFAKEIGGDFAVYESYGTAKVGFIDGDKKLDIEFVGARKEFYHRESRNPIVEDGTLEDDMARRDFTVNDMAFSLNKEDYGALIDPYSGAADLEAGIIRCVSDPVERFSEDPLRMLRAIRFASRFGFKIEERTAAALKSEASRINIIVKERIFEELNKMMLTEKPSVGLQYLYESGLMKIILPEIDCLAGRDIREGVGHKDILIHTFKVVDNAASLLKEHSDWAELKKMTVIWAALFHDMGKAKTKQWDAASKNWTFKDHEHAGAEMCLKTAKRMGFPITLSEKISKLVKYHMHPMCLCEDCVTDSAIRRFLFEAGDDIDMIMVLVNSDMTTSYAEKKAKFIDNYNALKTRMQEIEEKDALRNFKLAFTGDDIMREFGIPMGRRVGEIKEWYKNKVIDGELPNDYDAIKNAIVESFEI